MTREEATAYIKEWLKDEYLDGKDRVALTTIIEESEQEPKYCDRNICIQNEYNGIGCGECEVTKSGELCEDWYDVPSDEMTLGQARQAVRDLRKMWAEYLEQEPCGKDINVPATDAISRQAVLEYINRILNQGTGKKKSFEFIQKYVEKLPSVTPQPKTGHCKDCKWWKDSDGAYRRGIGAESKCPINRSEVFEGNGYCYIFEPLESEVEE